MEHIEKQINFRLSLPMYNRLKTLAANEGRDPTAKAREIVTAHLLSQPAAYVDDRTFSQNGDCGAG